MTPEEQKKHDELVARIQKRVDEDRDKAKDKPPTK